jgi:shikimate kinase
VHERLYLTGYMGAGKSTIGRLLALRLGYRFYDTDRQVMRHFQQSVTRIFQQHGEEAFRKAEEDILKELSERTHVVISTGGGTLTRDHTFQLAQQSGTLIYLQAPIEVLFERAIFSRKDRPMINVPDAEQVFRQRFEQRRHYYEQAHLVVSTHDRRTEAVVDEILDRLNLQSLLEDPLASDLTADPNLLAE